MILRVFGSQFPVDRRTIGLLAAASAFYMLANTLAQALIALGRATQVALGWGAGVVALLAVVLVGNDPLFTVEMAFVTSTATATLAMALLLQRALSAGATPTTDTVLEAINDIAFEADRTRPTGPTRRRRSGLGENASRHDQAVGGQRGAQVADPVGQAATPLARHAGDGNAPDQRLHLEAGVAHHLRHRAHRVEPQMRAVHDAPVGVVEPARQQRQAHRPVGDVRHADDQRPPPGRSLVRSRRRTAGGSGRCSRVSPNSSTS